MDIHIIQSLNTKIDASMHNSIKMLAVSFLPAFSVFVIALFPLYIRGTGARTARWLLTSLAAGIILYLMYIIYVSGGFRA